MTRRQNAERAPEPMCRIDARLRRQPMRRHPPLCNRFEFNCDYSKGCGICVAECSCGAIEMVSGIRHSYGKVYILKGIKVEAGEFLILVGPSGCSRSTLLNMVAWLDAPSSGRVRIGERDIAMVLLTKLFMFHEPLSKLDAKPLVEMRAEIKRQLQRTRTTTVYVTHDQAETMTLGDRVAVMNNGLVEKLGPPDDIYSRTATRFVAEFIGPQAMNMLAARRAGDQFSAQGGARIG